jgi:hypothetical protein
MSDVAWLADVRRRRLEAELVRLREAHRLQIIDAADFDAATVAVQDELAAIEQREEPR